MMCKFSYLLLLEPFIFLCTAERLKYFESTDDPSVIQPLDIPKCRNSGHRKLSYKHIPIPTPAQTRKWVNHLKNTRLSAKELEDGEIDRADVDELTVDVAARFSLLAYARLDGDPLGYHFLSSSGDTVDTVELQFLGTTMEKGNYKQAAHCVAYLYRLDDTDRPGGGVGVVLSFKGSTNRADWAANLDIMGTTKMRPEAYKDNCTVWLTSNGAPEACAEMHPGFMAFEQSLVGMFAKLSMRKLRFHLPTWNFGYSELPVDDVEHNHETFKDWLYSKHNTWVWLAAVGHSLGGAMASISAADIGETSGKTPLLATFGQPVVGNFGFKTMALNHVKPAGGLRFVNRADLVEGIGYMGKAVTMSGPGTWHNGLRINLRDSWEPLTSHTRYFLRSDVCEAGHKEDIEYAFPLTTYRPCSETLFGRENLIHFTGCKIVGPDGSCVPKCPDGASQGLKTFTGEAQVEKFLEEKACAILMKFPGQYPADFCMPKALTNQPHDDFCFYSPALETQRCLEVCSLLDGVVDFHAHVKVTHTPDMCKSLGQSLGVSKPKCEGDSFASDNWSQMENMPMKVKVSQDVSWWQSAGAETKVCACRNPLWMLFGEHGTIL